jgi:PAS domain S-box-containing protein
MIPDTTSPARIPVVEDDPAATKPVDTPAPDERRCHVLIDNLPDAILVIQDKEVAFANPAAARLLGRPAPAALLGVAIDQLVHGDSLAACEQCRQTTLAGKSGAAPVELNMLRADGGGVVVEALTYAFDFEDRPAVLAVLRDLTARRAIEREAERFRVALDSSPDAIFLIDPVAMRFLDANATARASLGYSREELLGLGPHDIEPEYNKTMLRQQFAKVLTGQNPVEVIQTLHKSKEGICFPVEVRLRAFPSGDQILLVAVARDISERLQAEARLRESVERFEQLATSVSEAFWIRDLAENRFIYVSPAYETLFGKPVASLYRHPRSFFSVVHPEDHDRVAAAFDEQRLDGQGADLEYRINGPQGGVRWIWARTFPIRDAAGKVYRSAGVAQDVTHRRESEEEYRSTIQASMDGFWITDIQTRLLDCNDAACRITGYGREELLTLSVSDLDVCETPEQTAEHARRISERGADHFETRHRRKDGRIIDIDISVYFRPTAEGGNFFVFLRDITDRKRAETELRLERDSNRLYLDTTQTMMVALDVQGRITMINRRGCELLGYRRDELLGRNWFETCLPQPFGMETVSPIFQRIMSGELEGVEYFENPVLCSDGGLRLIAWRNACITDGSGRIVGTLGSGEDITERKRAEDALRLSEARSRSILGTAPMGIGVLVKRAFTEVNEAMTRMTGYLREELIGHSSRLLYPTQAEFDEARSEKHLQIRERGIASVETRWRRKDGAIIDVALSTSPIVAGDPSQGMTFIAQDISTTKRAEQERLAHEASQRDALVREVHHRIKNNLMGVIGLLRQHISDRPDLRDPLEAAIAQINTISVVHGLQGRLPRKEPSLRDLVEEVTRAAATLALTPRRPAIDDRLNSDIRLDSGAAVNIALILNELVQNALKHGRPGDDTHVTISLAGDAGRVGIGIVNPGGPLPADFDLPTGRGCGTGLGLARTLLPRHGASLRITGDGGNVCAILELSPPVTSDPTPPAFHQPDALSYREDVS